jgi:hypothetical protein
LITQLWVCPIWGAVGAAATTAGTELVIGVVSCVLAARAANARLPIRSVLLALGITSTVAFAATRVELPWLPWLPKAIVAAGVFASALLLARVVSVEDARRLLSRRVL